MPRKIDTCPLNIKIPKSLGLRLKLRADLDEKTVTDVVIDALERHVKPVSVKEIEGAAQ